MKVAILTAGTLPVPAVKGGAVENLVESLASENESYQKLELVIISIFDPEAAEKAKQYPHTRFIFLQTNRLIEALDKIVYFFVTKQLKIGGPASYRNVFRRISMLRQTTRILSKENFDKIVLENSATLFRTLKGKRNYKKYAGNYYFHIHNAVTGSYGCEAIMKGCKTLAVSHYMNQSLPRFMQSIPKNHLRVVRNGIDTDRFHITLKEAEKLSIRCKYGLEPDDLVLLFVGRLTREKGIKELLLAFQQIKNANVKLLIVGSQFFDSDIRSPFEKQLKEIAGNMAERVKFTGFISYEEMPKVYAIADVAVLPSVWEDPAPLTIIESMASGLPVVTTDAGGIPEYVTRDGSIVLAHSSGLVKSLSSTMQLLIDDRNRIEDMGFRSFHESKYLNIKNFYSSFLRHIQY